MIKHVTNDRRPSCNNMDYWQALLAAKRERELIKVMATKPVFKTDLELTDREKQYYEDYVAKRNGGTLEDVTEISVNGITGEEEKVKVEWKTVDTKQIERVRRITGYLVGSLDRWNDGKRAEERDRVKHGI